MPHQNTQLPAIESNVISLQNKVTHMRAYSRDALDNYLKAVSHYRGFRLRFDSITSNLLDQLQNTEKERTKMVHRLLNVCWEIQTVMVRQSLKNIERLLKKWTATPIIIMPCSRRKLVRKNDLIFHPDDVGLFSSPSCFEETLCARADGCPRDDNFFPRWVGGREGAMELAFFVWSERCRCPRLFFCFSVTSETHNDDLLSDELTDDTPEVKQWCEKWWLVLGGMSIYI